MAAGAAVAVVAGGGAAFAAWRGYTDVVSVVGLLGTDSPESHLDLQVGRPEFVYPPGRSDLTPGSSIIVRVRVYNPNRSTPLKIMGFRVTEFKVGAACRDVITVLGKTPNQIGAGEDAYDQGELLPGDVIAPREIQTLSAGSIISLPGSEQGEACAAAHSTFQLAARVESSAYGG